MLAASVAAVNIRRRVASAVRSFPKGCGPAAPVFDRGPCDVPPAPSPPHPAEPSKSEEVWGPGVTGDPTALAEESVPSDRMEESLKPSCGSKQIVKPEASEFLNANPDRSEFPTRRRVSAIRNFPPGCGRSAHPVSREEREEVETKILDEPKPDADQETLVAVPVKTESTDTVATEVGKQTQVSGQEICAEIRVKPASPTSKSRGLIKRKIEGRDKEHTGNNNTQTSESQESKPSRSRARPRFGSKLVDEGGDALVGKTADMGSMKNQKNPKNVTRKCSENEADKSLEARGGRLIVQCLMAAPNCPWRQGRWSSAIGSRSATPKTKTMKRGNSSSN